MKKIVVMAILFSFVFAASASVTDTSFYELPTAWEVGNELEFNMTSQGSDLDRALFQYRQPGAPGFTDIQRNQCTSYTSCDWILQHSEDESGTLEYRFRIQHDGTGTNTRYQEVTFYHDLNYFVEWTEEPPETSSEGSEVEMSVTAHDSAERFNEEGILHLQYRNVENGEWETFDSRTCFNSDTEKTCSNSGTTTISSGKLEGGTASFRGLVQFKGDVTTVSAEEFTSLPGEEGRVDTVEMNNLPSEVQEGESFDITVDTTGQNLQTLFIQQRDLGDEGWTDWRSINCEQEDSCDFTRTYDVESTAEKEFRGYAEADGDSNNSETQTVDFLGDGEDQDRVDSVNINELPAEVQEGNSFEIVADAEGRNLQNIYIQERGNEDEGWTDWRSGDCEGDDTCELRESFDVQNTGGREFRAYAESETDSDDSSSQSVNFVSTPVYSVNTVRLDQIPDENRVSQDLTITGTAEGQNLDEIKLKTKRKFSPWRNEDSQDCDGEDECSYEYDYEPSRTGYLEFKLVAISGEDTKDSNIRVTEFYEKRFEVGSVSIDNLPQEHGLDNDLEIRGEARGENLGKIIIQQKDSDEDEWNNYSESDCSGGNCQISEVYSTDDEQEKDFRIRAESNGNLDYSRTETVSFVDQGGEVDSVGINNLPSEVEEEQNFDITVQATGQNLQRLYIQQRDEGEDEWGEWRSKSCGGENSCELSRTYSVEDTGEKEFRAYIEAVDTSEGSDLEPVSFTARTVYDIAGISIDSLPQRWNYEDDLDVSGNAEGTNLQKLNLKVKPKFGQWRQETSETCDQQEECGITYNFNKNSPGYLEFRIEAVAGGEKEESSIRTVDFYREEQSSIESVTLGSLPGTHPAGEVIDIYGVAEGENLDNLNIQKREAEEWSTIDGTNCRKNSECEFATTHIHSKDQEVDFRVKATTVESSATSNIITVNFQAQEVEVQEPVLDKVSIENLPDRNPVNNTIRVRGEAIGQEIDNITLEVRDEGNWIAQKFNKCSRNSFCDVSASYSTEEVSDKDFRIKAAAGDSVSYSSIESVRFFIPSEITSVSLDSLPSSEYTQTPITVSGSLSGQKLQSIEIQKKRIFDPWSKLASESCKDNFCSISREFSANRGGDVEFRIKGYTRDSNQVSEINIVEFERPNVNDLIENVEASSPRSATVGDEIKVRGQANGEHVDSISLQKKTAESWTGIDEKDCESDSCNIETNFSTEESGGQIFRTKAYSKGQSKISEGTETIFYPENGILKVEIKSLPLEHLTGDPLTVSGSARGLGLENVSLQTKTENNSWINIYHKTCVTKLCSVNTDYTENDEIEREFRIRAVTDKGTSFSNVETVNFLDVLDRSPRVSSVNLESLPNDHPTGDSLEISANSEGVKLDRLKIEKKRKFGPWRDLEQKRCDEAYSCRLETRFKTSNPGDLEFRAVSKAGDQTLKSGIEIVNFQKQGTDSDGDSTIFVKVEDGEGRNLENSRVRVRNGDTRSGYTNRYGEIDFNVDSGDYEITASKSGYETDDEQIQLNQGESETVRINLDRLNSFQTSITHQNSICTREDLNVEVEVENLESFRDSFKVSGTGLGGHSGSRNINIDQGDVGTVELTFEGVEESGNKEITVEVENSETRQYTRTVNVKDCVERTSQSIPEGISAEIVPKEVIAGEIVKIKGDVQGVRNPVDVTVSSSGFEDTVSSTRTGGYTLFYTPQSSGEKEFEISTQGHTTERKLNVLPRSTVSKLEAPPKVVEGESFELCAHVSSDVEPEVILFRGGDRVDSKSGSEKICFNRTAGNVGKKNFWVRASTAGQTGSASKKVDVIEVDEEFDTFPGQISVRKTEPGQAKIDLYNKDKSVREYDIEVWGLEETWYSKTDESVVLSQGQRKEVYLYFSPEKSGGYNPEIVVESGEKVFTESLVIDSTSTGSTEGGDFLDSII